jgi:signal peptidase I, bacterial type
VVKQSLHLVLLLFLLISSGCQTNTIKDTVTKEKLDVLRNPPSTVEKLKVNSDSMLSYSTYNPIAMDNIVFLNKSYYQKHMIARGDIVIFKTDDMKFPLDYGRIIGLPEEEVNLKAGHIYIDKKKLDAFYGSEFRGVTRYEKEPTSLEHPVLLGEGEYFVLGDYWQRSFHDSQTAGPIVSSDIVGKIVGWEGPKTAWDYQQGVIIGIESNRIAIVRNVEASVLREKNTDEIMGMAYPEGMWVVVEHSEEIQDLKIGDIVKYELVGEFKSLNPLEAKAVNFEWIGSVFE